MNKIVKALLGKVIISCQAYEDTPLFGSENMKIMAESVLFGKAEAIRACWPNDIKAIRSLGDFPIIGLNKVILPNKTSANSIIITPTLAAATEVIEAGCDIIAIDCTIRPFRKEAALLALLKSIKEKYPKVPIMADCSNLEECQFAEASGYVDIVATTLSGRHRQLEGPDIELLKEIKKSVKLPVNAEGNIWDLNDLEAVVNAGADMITIGTAITRPHLIAERFIKENKKLRSAD